MRHAQLLASVNEALGTWESSLCCVFTTCVDKSACIEGEGGDCSPRVIVLCNGGKRVSTPSDSRIRLSSETLNTHPKLARTFQGPRWVEPTCLVSPRTLSIPDLLPRAETWRFAVFGGYPVLGVGVNLMLFPRSGNLSKQRCRRQHGLPNFCHLSQDLQKSNEPMSLSASGLQSDLIQCSLTK